MFIGEYSHSVDPKNRLAVPSKFRGELGERLVVTRGLDKCLFVYPMKAWEIIAQKFSAFPMGDPGTRSFARLMLAGATDVDVDKQGRILLPEYLREYAQLKKDVVVAGLFDRIEIWDEKKWNQYKTKAEKDTDTIAKKLGDLGLY